MVHVKSPPLASLSAAPPSSIGTGGARRGSRLSPLCTSAGDQQVIQPNGQVHQLVEGEGGIPAGQIPTNILVQVAAVEVDKGPVVASRSCGQGPKFQGELLGARRPLPQVEEMLTRRDPP
jgi:hypothetical protein